MSAAVPPGLGPIFRSSPVLDALGSFYSKGTGPDLQIDLLVTERHANARGTVHGGVLATLADVGMGYLMAFGNARLLCGDRQVARASAVFAVQAD